MMIIDKKRQVYVEEVTRLTVEWLRMHYVS